MMPCNIFRNCSRQYEFVRWYAILFAFFVGNESDMNAIGMRLVRIGAAPALGFWFVNRFHILVHLSFEHKINVFRLSRQVIF